MEILKSCPFEEPVGKYKIENDKPMMTNEEWFDTLSTEEKAETIAQLSSYGGNVEAILNWLKERHDGSV